MEPALEAVPPTGTVSSNPVIVPTSPTIVGTITAINNTNLTGGQPFSVGGAGFSAAAITSTDLTSSTVNPTDLSGRSTSTQQLVFTVLSGQSTVPSDTLDEGPMKPNMRPAIFCSKPQLLKVSDSVDEDSWIIASSSCQPFTFEEHDGSLIVGTGPAKFAPAADRTLLLREGKMLVITVDKIHVVRTPFCNITVPVNTASIVEVDPQGMVRIANLAGGKASITICRNDETLILSAAPGDQLVLAEAAIADEQFCAFAYPEVAHSKVAAWNLELSGLRGQKVHFDRNEMAQHEPLLHCSMGCVNQTQLRRIEQLMQSMTSQEALLKSMALPAKGKQLIHGALPLAWQAQLSPISYQDRSLQLAPLTLKTLNAGSALVKYVGPCKVSLSSPGLIDLAEGEALVAAPKRTIVRMGLVHVELKAGTVAIISQHDGVLKVRDIYEKKGTSILTTVAGKKTIGLQAGQELIVGPRGLTLSRALGEDPVGRRKTYQSDLASGHTCISSEISLSSLMQNSAILAQLVRSEDAADRDMARRIMKMAVCLSVVTLGHGNYTMNP